MAGKIRKHTATGRSPWYTIWIDGRDVPLGTDYAAAHARASDMLRAIGGGGVDAPSSTDPAAVVVAAWLATGVPHWMGRHLIEWLDERLLSELVDFAGYAEHLSARGLAPASVRDYCRHARTCLEWGRKQGWDVTVPPMPAGMPKRVRAPRDIDPGKLVAALRKIRHAGPIVRFITAAGCRPREACNLEWEDVQLRNGTAVLHKHKTRHHGKSRTVYMSPAALSALAMVKTTAGPVFLSSRGRPYTPAGLRSILRRHGIPGAYCLRHTAAQAWLDDGVDFGVVAALLGHSDLRTVQVYAQVRDPRLVKAAKGLRSPLE